MLQTNHISREQFLRLFSGHKEDPDDGAVLDRTFCALRIWAIIHPEEMKQWTGTLKDAELTAALNWLLEHPWGPGLDE